MLGKLLSFGTLLSSLGLIMSVIVQIYGRFFMASAPSWTEEAARFFFIYAMSFGAGLALRDNEFVKLDIIFRKLSLKTEKRLKILLSFAAIVLFTVTGAWSIQYLIMGLDEQSPSMGMTMAIPFGGITLMAISVVYYSAFTIRKLIRD